MVLSQARTLTTRPPRIISLNPAPTMPLISIPALSTNTARVKGQRESLCTPCLRPIALCTAGQRLSANGRKFLWTIDAQERY